MPFQLVHGLHVAAYCKQVAAIHTLVEAGAIVDAQGLHGRTPLHEAALECCEEGVAALLGYGADEDMADDGGQTPLHLAASQGSWAGVEALLIAGADVNIRHGEEEDSALDWASIGGYQYVAELLVEYGADMNATTSTGVTALHKAACVAGWPGSLGALVKMGAVVDAQDEEGVTPLMRAASEGDCREAVVELLKLGAKIDARDSDQSSALHWAAYIAELKDVGPMMELLLESDADETAVGIDGLTAAALVEEEHSFEGDLAGHVGSPEYGKWLGAMDRVRDVFARAPAERRTRAWRRRRLLVMWRAYPGRFQLIANVIEGVTDGCGDDGDHRAVRSRLAPEGVEGSGVGGGCGRDGEAVGMLAARTAGLEEDGIFRGIVMFL